MTRDGTAEPFSRDQIFRRERGQGNTHSSCSADLEQDWQPYPVDPYIISKDVLYIVSVLFLFFVWCPYCMAINVSVQFNGGLLPDIIPVDPYSAICDDYTYTHTYILWTQCYDHRGTRLNAMKRFCLCSL